MEYTIGTTILNGWKITQLLGEGSYGKVFAIEKNGFGFTTRAALKLIRIPKHPSEIREALSEGMDKDSVYSYFQEITKRFVNEIAVMAQLKGHPNIVSCEDYTVEPHADSIGWDILIKMELLTGLTDYQLSHPMDEPLVRRLAEDICRALIFIQQQGLVHRDIKPANLFVDSLGQFKLGDFGVARVAELSQNGMSKQGTENYMAPEVYKGNSYGSNVDIYSLGLVLYRLMNRQRLPFYPPAPLPIPPADKENALFLRMKGEPLPPPIDASPAFAAIILKACAYDPGQRYQTAAEMMDALMQLSAGGAAAVSPVVHQGVSSASAPEEDDCKTLTMLASNGAPMFGEKEATEATLVGAASMMPPPTEENDDRTALIFADSQIPSFAAKSSSGTNPVGAASVAPPPTEEDDDRTALMFTDSQIPSFSQENNREARSASAAPPAQPEKTDISREDAMLAFWQENLTKLWSERRDPQWSAYYAPHIPLQLCANAIYNITASQESKEQILAVLNCTPDRRVPCGCGIVVTARRMYINLLMQNANAWKYPPAILEFDQLTRLWSGIQKGPLWQKYPSLFWTTSDGVTHSFGINMYPFVDYSTLAKLLSSDAWKACLK